MAPTGQGAHPDPHHGEAARRWGDTDAWAESQRRTGAFSDSDWRGAAEEMADLRDRAAALMLGGHGPGSPAAMDLAETARRYIDRRFYPCPPTMHRMLADMYLEDERFADHYDSAAPGLARWWHDAVHANADRAEEYDRESPTGLG